MRARADWFLLVVWLAACIPSMPALGASRQTAARSAPTVGRDVARGDQSNIDARREVVVRTQKEWTTLWREHDFDRPIPRVDFAKEMIVAVFLGSQTTAGHAVRIVEGTSSNEGFVVRYRIERPAAGGVAAQVLTFPYHIVAVPARSGAVRFERVE